ncbi:HIT domain-containing protein [Candidatus Dependentiae bacterium]|nr:HIT domain-containing protein [Candidatus Dependentiae bacterium]
MESSCIFCKIIAKEIPSTIIKENQSALAIRDIHPKAPTHYLIMPKMHIQSIFHMQDDHQMLVGQVISLARDIAIETEIAGFNLIANNGVSAGQSVMHMHYHFLAGANIYEHGLQL